MSASFTAVAMSATCAFCQALATSFTLAVSLPATINLRPDLLRFSATALPMFPKPIMAIFCSVFIVIIR